MDAEVREILEDVARSGPPTRAELREEIEERGGVFSERAVAEAICGGLIRPFSGSEETAAASGLFAQQTSS